MKREKEYTIRVAKDAKDKAIALSQRYGLPMKVVLSTLIDLCIDYDLLKPGWEKRLNAAMVTGARAIKLMESSFKLCYRCMQCGEHIFLEQSWLDWMFNNRTYKKPIECPQCNSKKRFHIDIENCYMMESLKEGII